MKILVLILRILLGAVFIFSAISKLFPIEVFELNFVYQGISGWDLAPYLSRGLIILELFLGVALLFNSLLKQFILPATFLLLFIFTVYLFYSIAKDGNSGNCGCFGTILPMTPLESIIKNIALMLLTAFVFVKTETKSWNLKWLLPSVFIVVSATIVLLYPIYDYSYATKPLSSEMADISVIKGFKGDEQANLQEGKKLVAVFNMACSHCIEVALKINAARARIKLPPTYFVLLGDSTEIKEFYDLTNSNAPFVLMQAQDFIKQFHSGWPRVLLLENGIIKYDNDHKTFNGNYFEQQVTLFLNKPI